MSTSASTPAVNQPTKPAARKPKSIQQAESAAAAAAAVSTPAVSTPAAAPAAAPAATPAPAKAPAKAASSKSAAPASTPAPVASTPVATAPSAAAVSTPVEKPAVEKSKAKSATKPAAAATSVADTAASAAASTSASATVAVGEKASRFKKTKDVVPASDAPAAATTSGDQVVKKKRKVAATEGTAAPSTADGEAKPRKIMKKSATSDVTTAAVAPVVVEPVTAVSGPVNVDNILSGLDILTKNVQNVGLNTKVSRKLEVNIETIRKMLKKLNKNKQKRARTTPHDDSKASGFNSLNWVTPEMEKFLGVEPDTKVPRRDITNKLSKFITEKSLKQENSGGQIKVKGNVEFEKLFPGKEVIDGHTELQKLINNHIVVKIKNDALAKFMGVAVGDRILKKNIKTKVAQYCTENKLINSFEVQRGKKTERVDEYIFDDTLKAAFDNTTLAKVINRNLQKRINTLTE